VRLILVTLDDVSFYSLGFVGFFPDFTPNINKFANESYTFWNAHCNIPFCEPSRAGLMTGLYPQNNGSTCFIPINEKIPCITSILVGYHAVLCGKNSHYKNMRWDANFIDLDGALKYCDGINEDLLFSVNLNVHRKFVESKNEINFKFPNYLPNTKPIREEISDYLFTLKRADLSFGKVVEFFDENDIVILTSDHGMSFPYIKGDCYGTSTNVPLMIRNKNILPCHDKENLVSHVDFLPTMAEWLNFEGKFDGQSYYKLLLGEKDKRFFQIYSQLNKMLHGPDCKIRALTRKNHCYIVNINQDFPGDCVDGWGWAKSLNEMGKDYFLRPVEQLIEYDGFNIYPLNDESLKLEMRNELFSLMKRYHDPELFNAKQKFLKFI